MNGTLKRTTTPVQSEQGINEELLHTLNLRN